MIHPGTVVISASGSGWKALKAEIQDRLVKQGFRRTRTGRFEIDDLDADKCVVIIDMIYSVEESHKPTAIVRELTITCSPHITIRIRRPVQK